MNVLLSNYDEVAGTVVLNCATGPVDDMIHVAQVMTFTNERRLNYERQLVENGAVVRAFNAAMQKEIAGRTR